MAVSSWDGTVLVYTVSVNSINLNTPEVNPYQKVVTNGPILGICW